MFKEKREHFLARHQKKVLYVYFWKLWVFFFQLCGVPNKLVNDAKSCENIVSKRWHGIPHYWLYIRGYFLRYLKNTKARPTQGTFCCDVSYFPSKSPLANDFDIRFSKKFSCVILLDNRSKCVTMDNHVSSLFCIHSIDCSVYTAPLLSLHYGSWVTFRHRIRAFTQCFHYQSTVAICRAR